LHRLAENFQTVLQQNVNEGGYGKSTSISPSQCLVDPLRDGSVVIAAITSCTNTSNPKVMLTAGLLAKNAREKGLTTKPWVKTSLAPGSRVVSQYFETLGLQTHLDALGFNIVGYSCTTCVGSSGPLKSEIEDQIKDRDLVACAVLSGNRNFEARIHPSVRAAYLASPPLVVAFALTGRIDFPFDSEPIGISNSGAAVYLKDIWPNESDIQKTMALAMNPDHYLTVYKMGAAHSNPFWMNVPSSDGQLFNWNLASLYIKEPPFLSDQTLLQTSLKNIVHARALAILGDSITTDHISPIGTIATHSPAGIYLKEMGVRPEQFNNYGSRRMNHEIMVRGTFSNIRLKNKMVGSKEGGITVHVDSQIEMPIFDAAEKYAASKTPLVIFAGEEYGTGSARDWAAKATRLVGVKAVIAKSFERIHRSNLVGMGVLPCQLPEHVCLDDLQLTGNESFDLMGFEEEARPRQKITLVIHRTNGNQDVFDLVLRLDTNAEFKYVSLGGILPYIMHELTAGN
jgi:aconitate hydratase